MISDLLSAALYSTVRTAIGIGCAFGFSMRVKGQHHIPRQGPALLIANHQSFLDPPLVGVASPRPLCYLARKTLFRNPLFGGIIRQLRAVPVDQEGVGKEGLKAVLGELQKGNAVLVFPEGERCLDGVLHPLKPGVQLLIKRVQAPIVPIGIAGAFDAWRRGQAIPRLSPPFLPANKACVSVYIGKPLDGRRCATLSKQQLMDELFVELQKVVAGAERIRRRPRPLDGRG